MANGEQPTVSIGRLSRMRKYRLRLAALVNHAIHKDDAPGIEFKEQFLDVHFVSQFQADIFRQTWRDRNARDPEFELIVHRLGARKWPPKMDRYILLWQVLRSSLHFAGDVIECGVYKGASARLAGLTMQATSCGKRLLLLDTFTGLPAPTGGKDAKWKAGDLGDVTLEEVAAYLSDLAMVDIYRGLFQDTFPALADRSFCFCHVDCDLYASVRECCEFLYERTVPGGRLLFDDYGVPYCPGARLAVDEFFQDKKEKPVYLPTGQCLVVKD